ncbi:carbohydrate ABC transporter permease [Kribbella sandramycini]|uniref:Carbohydrate ABC transporter permease n=1 Tax=Kribbella sandramycini TaxID=60450 RepID=A0A7Y4P0J2_9ACTN|nr:carbohydrate ABC transporter permease [Kribbella sandramycini]MBB6565665.1 multiple sugar transport system permease protein [Kribbella sandramycini]NOL41928.1 carbohydrate ABC transporter permease [Kribbella sandramycini]
MRKFQYAMCGLLAVVVLAPFGWLVISSLSPADELTSGSLWPSHPTLSRYQDIFTSGPDGVAGTFRVAMLNSLVVASVTTVISLVVGCLGGYAFARLRFRFRRTTLFAFLAIYMLPPIALVIPLYLALANLQLLDTQLGLIITYCSIVTPFCLWTMSNFYLGLPTELEDAARVDGCSRLGALIRIVLPLARPGIVATAMFGFLLAWDEFLYSLIFTSTPNAKTIPVAIAEFTGKFSSDFGLVAAGGVLAALPPVLLALLFQRYIVTGLTAGAVKG